MTVSGSRPVCDHESLRRPASIPRRAVCGSVFALLIATSAAAEVTHRPVDDLVVLSGDLDERVQLLEGWRYHPGDDPSWAEPGLDDSGWVVASSLLPRDDLPPGGWPGIGWFRRRLTLGDGMPATALAVRPVQSGASELYLDGRLIARFGAVSTDPAAEQPMYANDFIGAALDPGRVHVLAVRYSNSRGNLFGGRLLGFGLNMRSVESAAHSYHRWDVQTLVYPAAFGGAFTSLAVLHLMLFLFHRASREHLFFAAFAALMTASLALRVRMDLTTDLVARLGQLKIATVVGVAMVLVGLALVHVVFRRRPLWSSWLVAVGGVGVAVWTMTLTAFDSQMPMQLFSFFGFVEMARVSIAAVFRREIDAWIVATAFVPVATVWVAITVTRMLGQWIAATALMNGAMFVLALAFSLFISRRAARTSRELELRLVEVGELSRRALEQARRAEREEAERRHLEAERARRSEELEAARRIQLAMLPPSAPQIPGFEIAYRMLTATEVGGDCLDIRAGNSGRALLAVGDATSHGLQAGMVVALAKSFLRDVAADQDPAEVLKRVGAGLGSLRERHASMAMLVMAIDNHHLRVASAGMPPLLVLREPSAAVEEIMLPGVPLGTLADASYPTRGLSIEPGDVLLAMSDGIVEALSPSGEPFGYDRVARWLQRSRTRSAEETVDGLLAELAEFTAEAPLADDVTLVALHAT